MVLMYPEWRFLKTPAFRLRVDGRKRMSIVFISVFVWTEEDD